MMNLRITILLVAALFSGCYAKGPSVKEAPQPSSRSDLATVYFYRQPGPFGAWVPLVILIDGKRIGSIGQNGYTWVQIPPGRHTINNSVSVKLETNLEPGTHYIRFSTHSVPGGNMVYTTKVTEQIALSEMGNLKYVPSKFNKKKI